MASAYGRAAPIRCCAFTIRDAAMSSIARVIFFVDCTDRMRRRYRRSLAPKDLLRLPVGVALGLALAGGFLVVAVATLCRDLLLAFLALAHRLGGVLLLPDRVTGRGLELLLEVRDRALQRLDRVVGQLTALHDG